MFCLVSMMVQKPGREKQVHMSWAATMASKSIPLFASYPLNPESYQFTQCNSFVTKRLDTARINSFVVLGETVSSQSK